MTEYHVLDLFCGLGGFSQAFKESDRWDVTTVDIEDRFEPDITADVMDLRPSDFEQEFDVVLASPPCKLFSLAGHHDKWDHENKEPITDLSRDHYALAHHTRGLVKALSPEYWFLENPMGRMQWVLGRPTNSVTYCQYGTSYYKRTDLWGSHPPMQYRKCGKDDDCHTHIRTTDEKVAATSAMSDDYAERSKVPYDLSEDIRDACEQALDGDAVEQVEITGREWSR